MRNLKEKLLSLRLRLEGGVVAVEVDGIDTRDYPDFCDAFIAYAEWKRTGLPLSEAALEWLNEDGDFRYACVEAALY